MVVDLLIEYSRDNAVAYAHLEVSSDCAACEYGSVFGFNSPYLHIGVLGFESLTDTCYRTACADTGAETVNPSGSLLEYLKSCEILVGADIIDVLELLRHKNIGI